MIRLIACFSYARKYALNGLLAIDNTKDADATNNHGKKSKKSALVDTTILKKRIDKSNFQFPIDKYISGFKKEGLNLSDNDVDILTRHYNTNKPKEK